MSESESDALPLGDTPMCFYFLVTSNYSYLHLRFSEILPDFLLRLHTEAVSQPKLPTASAAWRHPNVFLLLLYKYCHDYYSTVAHFMQEKTAINMLFLPIIHVFAIQNLIFSLFCHKLLKLLLLYHEIFLLYLGFHHLNLLLHLKIYYIL